MNYLESEEEWMNESTSVIEIEEKEEDETDHVDQITEETYSSSQYFDYEFTTKALYLENSLDFTDQTGTMKVCMKSRESQLLEKIHQLTVENHKLTNENHRLTIENHRLTVENHRLTDANIQLFIEII